MLAKAGARAKRKEGENGRKKDRKKKTKWGRVNGVITSCVGAVCAADVDLDREKMSWILVRVYVGFCLVGVSLGRARLRWPPV